MAKTNPAPTQDLNDVMSFVANRTPSAAPTAPAPSAATKAPVETEESVEVAQPTAEADQVAEGQSTPGKKKAAPRVVDETASWAENFLQPVRNRKTKAIYVDEETHAALVMLTQEGGVGLADLLINITNNHFDTYKAEIREFLAERERLKKKKSRF